MGNSESKTEYNIRYAKEKLKRIPLDVQKEKYEEIKAAADAAGEILKRQLTLILNLPTRLLLRFN